MKKVAIPVMQNSLSQYFGQCSHYQVYTIDGDIISLEKLEVPDFAELSDLPKWIAKKGISDIIAFKIDKKIISEFINNKINLFIGVPVSSPDSLIDDYLNGSLRSNQKIIREITQEIIN